MIDGLKPYPDYKESGVSWLGRTPAHWSVRRMKYILRERDVRSIEGKEQLLRVSQYTGVTQRRPIDGLDIPNTRAESLVGYKKVQPDELVVNIMLAWNGSLGASRYPGIVSPAYCVYHFGSDAYPWYFHHLLRTPLFKGRIKSVSTGVVESRLRLYSDDLYRLEAFVPPYNEQAAIVKFLDHSTRKLNRAIRAKQKVIELLNEQKQVIINNAVTRGLDPDVPLKPSGIPWLGDIPKHWEVIRAKYVFYEVDERSNTGDEELLSVSHITGVTPRSEKNITMFKAKSYIGHKLCQSGDLVINTMWAWMAALGVSKYKGLISPSYAVYRPRDPERLLGKYFDNLLRTAPYVSEYICRSTGIRSSRLRLYPEFFFRIPIIIPPIEEQRKIVFRISLETEDLIKNIQQAKYHIDLLQELRTRLIADVVTGKLDVREAASHLPVEAEELELDMEGIDEIEEEFEESKDVREAYG